MTRQDVIDRIKRLEGFEPEPYLDPDPPKDPENPTRSIFHGHQIRPGETVAGLKAAGPDRVVRRDVEECAEDVVLILQEKVGVCEGVGFRERWDSDRVTDRDAAIVDMRYQLGPAGLRGFPKMWDRWANGDFDGVRHEAIESKWYRDLLRWGSHRGMDDVCMLRDQDEEEA